MVLTYFRRGMGTRDIALHCGISTQAVNQHIRELRARGDIGEDE